MRFLLNSLIFSLFFSFCKNEKTPDAAAQNSGTTRTDTATGAPIRIENPWKQDACSLFSDADFQQVFGVDIAKTGNKQTISGSGFCLWHWKKTDWKERENASEKGNAAISSENALSIKIISFGTTNDAHVQFEAKRTKDGGSVIPGLGDEAAWSEPEKTMVVRKGVFCLNVSLDYSDDPKQNFEKAKTAALTMLAKI